MQKTDFKLAGGTGPSKLSGEPAIAFRTSSSASELGLITRTVASPPTKIGNGAETAIRICDVIVAAGLIVLLAPALLLIFAIITIGDPGPAIFAHRRVGKDGRLFHCYKFRTMYSDSAQRLERILAENPTLRREWSRDFKLTNDPRVTPVGKFLRVLSLDELPQLFNVLGGTMSLVGPRPIIEPEMQRYHRFIRHYLSVRPGLTGLWQVSGRSNTTYQRRVAADVLYVRRRSLMFNLKILWATIPAVLACEGSR